MIKNKVIYIFILIVTLTVPYLPATAYNQTAAQSYLQSHSNNPWSVMALLTLGADNGSTDFLKNISATSAIDYEAPILAITALGQNPKTFANQDYIAKLKSFYTNGQIGDPETINDDIFGMLALVSSGLPTNDETISGAKNFLLAHQNADGGWGYAQEGNSDSNTTASAITALISAGLPPSDSRIQNALAYLKTTQNDDGGLTYDPKSSFGTASDPSSTAWVMWALTAAGIDLSSWSKSGHTPTDYLQSQQNPAGFFDAQETSFTPIQTAYAVIALAGKTLPLKILTNAPTLPLVSYRIEGKDATVCSGQVNASTALDVVKNAADSCGFTYNIKTSSFGQYLNQINQDTAFGDTGWLYLVNFTSPSVGAADYQLKDGDAVIWYFGNFGWKPLRLGLSVSQAGSGQPAVATVESFDGSSWSNLTDATVYFGSSSAATDSNGHATISAPDGYYRIYSQKDRFIRSNSTLLKIGQPNDSAISLSANFSGGQVQGTSTPPNQPAISFTVNSNSLDFGNLSPGASKSQNLNIHNNGSTKITLSGSVSGDPLFTQNLLLANTFWQNFSANLDVNQSLALPATVKVPANFSGSSGAKTGQLILWASPE